MSSSDSLRWLVLVCTCIGLFGQYFAFDLPSALNEQLSIHLHEQLDYMRFQYFFNMLYSVYAVPNIFLPFLFGHLVDRLGERLILFMLSACVLIGQGLCFLGVLNKSLTVILMGRVVFGVGGESMNVVQASLLATWFKNKEIAFALGLNLSVARLGSVLNDLVSPRLEVAYGLESAFLMGVFMVFISFVASMSLCYLGKPQADEEVHPSLLNEVKELPQQFWMVAVICVLVYSVILPFNNVAAAFLTETWYSALPPDVAHRVVGSVMSILFAVSALLSPGVGLLIDLFGRRLLWLEAACILVTLAHLLMGLFPPALTMAMLGLAYTVFASVIWPLVSFSVESHQTGLAYGITTALQNAGLAVVPMGVAAMRRGGSSFMAIEKFFCFLGACGILGSSYLLLYHEELNLSEKGIKDLRDDMGMLTSPSTREEDECKKGGGRTESPRKPFNSSESTPLMPDRR